MRWCATSVRLTTAPIEGMVQPNCNDQIAAQAFGAIEHVDPTYRDKLREYDGIFLTMWKVQQSWESRWMDVAHWLKVNGKAVVLFQEAETSWPMTRSWEEMQSFIELLGKVDLFLTHQQRDVRLWGALRKGVTARWRTCIDTRIAERYRIEPHFKDDKPLLFGSSYDGRANGLTGLIACKDIGRPLWHQNRSTGYADRNEGIPELLGVRVDKEIGHMGWGGWLRQVAGAYIAVHPMPAAAAGRDQIAFAALGIPCIGSVELDIQRELFPLLAIEPFDVDMIGQTVEWLLRCPDDYYDIRSRATDLVKQFSLEEADHQAKSIKERMGWL